MFSPDAATNSHSLRPKRTRQAVGNDDSVKLPQAKRKRSVLRRDTFEPLAEASVNEIAGRQNADSRKPNGHATDRKTNLNANDNANQALLTAQPKELTLRGGRKVDKRSERGAASLLLSSNDFYTVSQLPALPEAIRNSPNLPYSCIISSEYGYALALTHTDALIWPYNASSSIPSARDVISFKLPLPPTSANDPLPLASFTAKDAGGEPGILVISPRWGKVVYWESITNASTIIPGQASNGVQGSIHGMFSGEIVKEITNAEPSGYVLTFNHGRVAHLTVRDQMGRPAIGVHFLRKPPSAAGNAFLGSIRSVLVGDRRKGTPLVRAGGAAKGQRNVVILTEDGDLEEWETSLSGADALKLHINLKDAILESLAPQSHDSSAPALMQFSVLDFELASIQQTLSRRGSVAALPLIALVSLCENGRVSYYILELLVSNTVAQVKVVHPIKCFSDGLPRSQPRRQPSLSIARSSQLAFAVFETAVVLFSLAKIQESPTSQILMERHELPDPFQDCVRFQEDTIYRVLGFSTEEYDQKPGLLLAVQGFGIIRILSQLRDHDESDEELYQDTISAKSKLEQAVFFGTMKHNPLDLTRTTENAFSSAEIESAAMAISSEILSSSSNFLPKSMPSIDQQIKQRAKALHDLISHLMKQYRPKISRNLLYQLLWNAEKLSAAQAIWKVQEEIQRRYPLDDREMSYLDFCLRALHQTRQKYPDDEKGEKDRVRFWLYNSVEKIGFLLIELVDCFVELEDMDVTDPKVVGEYMKEAMDLWVAAYTAAFKFREDNATQYGLGDDIFKDGVLVAGYPPEIEHPWTSTKDVFHYAHRMLVDLHKYMNEWWTFDPNSKEDRKKNMPASHADGKPHDPPPRALLNDIAAKLPTLVDLFNRLVSEQIVQAVRRAEQDPDRTTRLQRIAEAKSSKRPFQTGAIMEIRNFNMPGAIELAENLKDPGLLVTLTTEYLRKLMVDAHSDPQHATRYQAKIKEVQENAESYYDRFGKGWAFANFSHMIQEGQLGSVFTTAQVDDKKQKYLTWFMKKGEKYGQQTGKISWINDIVGERNFVRAEETLNLVASDEEHDLWNKKTELSLAKLASLAALEADQEISTKEDSAVHYDNDMMLIEMQEAIQAHIDAAVGPALDAKAAEELAMENFAARVVDKKSGLKKVLKTAIQGILAKQPLSIEEMVDILTLGDPVAYEGEPEEDPGVLGNEFAMALKAIDLSSLPVLHKTAVRHVVWRRAMIRDDWNLLNDTTNKSDDDVQNEMQQSALFRTLLQMFEEAALESPGANMSAIVEHKICSPTQILEQGVLPGVLLERFYGDEKVREAIKKDLEKEQQKLRAYVEKAQLEKHFSGLVPLAERVVKEAFERAADQSAQALTGAT